MRSGLRLAAELRGYSLASSNNLGTVNPLQPLFEAPIRERVAPLLKAHGFKKKALTFSRATPDVLQILNVQKSSHSDSTEIAFAVNFGVASLHLLERFGRDVNRCTVWDCHLQVRVGGSPFGADRWWQVRDRTSAEIAVDQVMVALSQQALPLFDQLQTDVGLCTLWKTRRDFGTTEGQRLLYLAELTRKSGSNAEAKAALDALKAAAAENKLGMIALQYLREVG